MDVCGPFRPGEDFPISGGRLRHSGEENGANPFASIMVEALGCAPEEPLLPEAEPEEVAVREGDGRALKEWERLEVEAEEVAIRNYTMVETLTSRNGTELKAGLANI